MVRAGHDGCAIVLGVEDRGHGLDACEREHVFEPFYRAEGVRASAPREPDSGWRWHAGSPKPWRGP